jgi:hypothetical protein
MCKTKVFILICTVPLARFTWGPQGDLQRLFAVGGRRTAMVADLSEMNHPEIDIRLGPPTEGSHTGTSGEPALFEARGWVHIPPAGFFIFPFPLRSFPVAVRYVLARDRCSWHDKDRYELFTPVS